LGNFQVVEKLIKTGIMAGEKIEDRRQESEVRSQEM
jgi:hypothetical protein